MSRVPCCTADISASMTLPETRDLAYEDNRRGRSYASRPQRWDATSSCCLFLPFGQISMCTNAAASSRLEPVACLQKKVERQPSTLIIVHLMRERRSSRRSVPNGMCSFATITCCVQCRAGTQRFRLLIWGVGKRFYTSQRSPSPLHGADATAKKRRLGWQLS